MENIFILILLIINILLSAVAIFLSLRKKDDSDQTEVLKKIIADESDDIKRELEDETDALRRDISENVTLQVSSLRSENSQKLSELKQELTTNNAAFRSELTSSQDRLKQELVTSQEKLEKELTASQEKLKAELSESQDRFKNGLTETVKEGQRSSNELLSARLEALNEASKKQSEQMNRDLTDIRSATEKKLDDIRGVVDEKLTETLNKRINESFKNVSEQLEQVYKGLGEMKNLAGDVGGLKAVLSGVKTRGILGEYQLGAILEEILSPEQYETNVATVPESSERVEYAIKLPGGDGGHVYLPIDSKFPGDAYSKLLEAYDSSDRALVDAAKKVLVSRLKAEAKDIREKYVEVPYTTNFGIMFLPFEGLYSEAVNMGMVEVLQKDYQVNIAGPSTMGAMLSSLQMGFKTLAIQKRSSEVWNVLAAVKTEFEKFGEGLEAMHKHLDLTNRDLEKLMNTRTNAINRKLRNVQSLEDAGQAENILLEINVGDEDTD